MQEIMKPDHELLDWQASAIAAGGPFSKLTLDMDEGALVVGLQFICPPGLEMEVLNEMCVNLKFPVTVTMPCGESAILVSAIGLVGDMPCPCGNPNHWIIKWEIQGEVENVQP